MVNYGGNDGPVTTAVSTSSTTSSTTSTSSSSTGTATGGSATTTATATASASATSSPGNSSGSSSGISGGAVAGIVIGVVAGIAVVGGAFWLGRRRRGGSGGNPGHGFGSAAGSGPGAGYVQPGTPIGGSDAMPYGGGYMGAEVKAPLQSMYENHPMSPLPVYQPPVGQQFAELPGESARVEMSDTSRVNELAGSAKR